MDRRENNGYQENDTAQIARERIIETNSKYEPKKSVKNTIENGRLKSVQQILKKSNTSTLNDIMEQLPGETTKYKLTVICIIKGLCDKVFPLALQNLVFLGENVFSIAYPLILRSQ